MKGIERIKVLGSEITDEALKEIIKYLCSREDMDEKYLNEEKSLKQMVEFIRKEASKKAVNNMAIIKDEVVFGWAIHYFDESNEDLGLKNNVSMNKVAKVEDKNNVEEPQNTIVQKRQIKSSKKVVPEGQLSLF